MSDVMEREYEDDVPPEEGGAISDDDLRVAFAREKKAREEAEAERRRLESELNRERSSRTDAVTARFEAEEQAIDTRMSASDAKAVGLRRDYSQALSEGDFDKAADIQDQMATLRAEQQEDKRYKKWLEGQKEQAKQQAERPVDPGAPDLSQYSSRQRAWIKAHPDFMTDVRLRQKVFAGHQLAVADGIEVDSDEYFETINRVALGEQPKPAARRQQVVEEAEEDSGVEVAPPPGRRRQLHTEIPTTRRSLAPHRPAVVRLTSDQRDAADIALPDVEIEGKYDAAGNWVPGRYERYMNRHLARNGGKS